MSGWLDSVRSALDRAASPVAFFVRDDDAGWSDDCLYRLLDVTQRFKVPIDLAVIPAAVGASLARELRLALDRTGEGISVHQHGLAHVNHESIGRKAEFGPSRSFVRQREDIGTGQRKLQDRLGAALCPIFTPPWNRCVPATGAALLELGFQVLSCDAGAPAMAAEGLEELPVHLDWTGRRGARWGAELWGMAIASRIATAASPIGLMLHHAVMTADDRRLLSELLAVLSTHQTVRLRTMSEWIRPASSVTA
jgi:predicted deacetylase